MLNFSYAAEPVPQHPLEPFWVESLGSSLEPDCFFKRSHLGSRRESIGEVDSRASAGLFLNGFRDAAKILEVVINIRDSDFGRVNILVRDFDPREGALEKLLRLTTLEIPSLRVTSICKALTSDE